MSDVDRFSRACLPPQTFVALGPIDPDLVEPFLASHQRLVLNPSAEDLAVADAAIVRAAFTVDNAMLDRMPALKVLARTGVGTDLVDVAESARRGIPVVITPGSNTSSVAEGVFAHLLAAVKRLSTLTSLVREGRWHERGAMTVGDLDGATLGIIGFGRIGIARQGSPPHSTCASSLTIPTSTFLPTIAATVWKSFWRQAISSRCMCR